MSEIFHVYASQGPNNYVEMDLPASDYEMLDLMERLRLEPGQPPYVEILKFREGYDYLEKCIPELPDIYQLNALARKLAEFTSVQDMAAFEGLVGKEIKKGAAPIELLRLIDFAHSTDCCHVAEGAVTDFQLGKFLVENDFIEDTNGLPESALALLDYGKIGREHREQENGVFTGFGYVEQHSEVHHVSENMDFQPGKPSYTVLLNVAHIRPGEPLQQEDMVHLGLPAPERQIQEALAALEQKDWSSAAASVWDCPIPSMCRSGLFIREDILQVLEFAETLQAIDARDEMPKYKALLTAMDCKDIGQAIALAGTMGEYMLEPQISSPEDVARGELGIILCDQDAKALLPHIDLTGYGRALLERDYARITGYGLLERDKSQPIQTMEQKTEGMVMT